MHWFLSSQLQDQLNQPIRCYFEFKHEKCSAHASTSYYFLSEWITVSSNFSNLALICHGTCSLFFLKVNEHQTHFAVLKCCSKVWILSTNEQKYEIFIFTHILYSLVTNSLSQKVWNWSVETHAWRLKVFQACFLKCIVHPWFCSDFFLH